MKRRSNKINVPKARAAMDKFKMEAAAAVGVKAKEGCNGHNLPRGRQCWDQMVTKVYPIRTVNYQRNARTAPPHLIQIKYIANLRI